MKIHRARKYSKAPLEKPKKERRKNWIERNPSLSQLLITVFTIIITAYFSIETLNQSSEMFLYSQKKDLLDGIIDSAKRIKQDSVTNEQLQLSRAQNRFIEQQLITQQNQFSAQYKNDQVNFVGDSIQFKDRKNGNGEYYFMFRNNGKRTGEISRIIFMLYNLVDTRYLAVNRPEDIDVGGGGSYTLAHYLPYDLTNNLNTVVITRIFYKDDGVQRFKDLAFKINFDRLPRVGQAPVTHNMKNFVLKQIKSYIKNRSDFFENPYFDGEATYFK